MMGWFLKMQKNLKNSGQEKVLKYGLVFLGTAIVVGFIYLFLSTKGFSKTEVQAPSPTIGVIDTKSDTDISDTANWDVYEDPDYSFAIQIPRLLKKTEIPTNGVYLKFIIFVENYFSAGNGVAVGIREDNAEMEISKIKAEIAGESVKSKLTREFENTVNNFKVHYLYYEPEEVGEGESRAIAIINTGGYSYSISATHDQINKVVATFKTEINVTTPTPIVAPSTTVGGDTCGGFANLPCPKGFKCVLDGKYPDAGGTCVKE